MKIEVFFPGGPRMWPAHAPQSDGTSADAFTLIPTESTEWRFAVTRGGRWKAYGKQITP